MTEIVFVTSNENKHREVESILDMSVKRVSLDLPEIQSMDLMDIIGAKLSVAYEKLQRPVIVEDTGLFLDAWHGFPGPFVKHALATMGNQGLVNALPKGDRTATWQVVYGYCNGGEPQYFVGEIAGKISDTVSEAGWGFDPIFIPDGETVTYGELGDKKHEYSARKIAIEKLRDGIKNR